MSASGTQKAMQETGLPDPWASVAESSPMPIVVISGASGVIRYANPAFCRLVGKIRQEVIGDLIFPIVPDGDVFPALLTRVYQTKEAVTHIGTDHSASHG